MLKHEDEYQEEMVDVLIKMRLKIDSPPLAAEENYHCLNQQ